MTRQARPLLGDLIAAPELPSQEMDMLATLDDYLTQLAPDTAARDATGRYPDAAIDTLRASGLFKTALAPSADGAPYSQRFSLEAQLRLATVDSAVAQIFKVHDELMREMPHYSSPAQAERLRQLVHEEDAVIGLAVAEAGKTAEEPLRTTCIENDAGEYVIDGEKIYTTGAAGADYIATWAFNAAQARADDPVRGMQLLLVPRTQQGITIHRDWNALGQRATDSGRITFDNVVCPAQWLASVPGLAPLPVSSLRYQAGFAAVLVGIGMGALNAAAPFVAEYSRPWAAAGVDKASDDPMIQRNLGEMAAALVSAYHATMATAHLFDAFLQGKIPRGALALPVSVAKAAAHSASLAACAEIHGLMGTRSVDRKYGFDIFWRNARTLSLHDPVDYKRIELGKHLLSGWHPEPGLYQ